MSKKLERDIERWVASRKHPARLMLTDMLLKRGDRINIMMWEFGGEKAIGIKRHKAIQDTIRVIFDDQKPTAYLRETGNGFNLEVGLPLSDYQYDDTHYVLPLRELLMTTISSLVQRVGSTHRPNPGGAMKFAAVLRHYADIAEHATKLAQAGHDDVMIHNHDHAPDMSAEYWMKERDTGYAVRLPLPKETDHG